MTTVEGPTVEELFAPPTRAGATLSPDGTRIAFLAPRRDRLNVWVQALDASGADDGPPRCVTADETRSVVHFEWTPDPRWLLYTQDEGGDENHHLFRVDLDDPDAPAVDLTPYPGARVVTHHQPHGRPGTVLLIINARRLDQMDLVELDIATGALTVLAENPGAVLDWVVTPDREVFALVPGEGSALVLTRWTDGSAVAVLDGDDHPLGVAPLEPSADGGGVWLGAFTGDRLGVARLDLTTGRQTPVDSHPDLDVDAVRRSVAGMASPLIRHRRTGALLGVRYLGEKEVIHALDPHFADVLGKLEALSDGTVGNLSSDDEGRRWVVGFVHDRDPGVTWLYDHATGEARLLFRPFPHLDPQALAPMAPVTITARDGLPLPAYLTLPAVTEPASLVLLVHGGPWSREAWGYDPAVQLLAARGHAVLQVDFRGSVGHGRRHMQAAIGEFAGKMHDDLIDAADWAVAQGHADPDRLAIMGGSFGGYATLVAITTDPDRFAAAVDYVGVSDWENFLRTLPSFARPGLTNNFHRYLGDPEVPEQAAQLRARSPIHRVDRIRTPLLVAQGANDVRVVRAESDNVVAALRARGVDVEYLVKEDEGHGFLNPENQLDLYRAVERFFARHLQGVRS